MKRWHKQMANWIVVKAKIQKEMIDLRRVKVYKNDLLIIRCRLVHLGFVDAYKKSYGAYTQKCIEYFTILL